MAFDTLTYARRLKQAGVPDLQAEAMADATRELFTADIATKPDLAELRNELKADIAELRNELKADIAELRNELKADIAALKMEIAAVEQRVTAAMGNLELRLTVRLGGLIAVGIAILAAIIKL